MTRWEVTKAVRASDLPSASRLIMLTLADVAEVGTAEIPAHFTPSLKVLAEETALDRRTVQRHLVALESIGWVVRTRPDGKGQWRGERVRYRLDLPSGVEPPAPPVQAAQDRQTGGTVSPEQAAESPIAGGTEPPLKTDHSDQFQIFTDHTASATPPKASKTTKRVTDDDPNFAAFWKAYPRRTDKGHARTAWSSVAKAADGAAIIAGAEAFAAQCTRNRTETRFIPHPATWLRGERWTDEPMNASANGHRPFTNPTDEDAYGGTL